MKTLNIPVIARNIVTRQSTNPVIASVARQSNLYKTFSRLFAIVGLLMMLAVSGWAEDKCGSSTVVNLSSTNTSGELSGTTKGDNNNDYMYFNFVEAGKLTVWFSSNQDDSVAWSDGGNSCPGSDDDENIKYKVYTQSAGYDFNIRIYRHSNSDTKSYTLKWTFLPDAPAVATANNDSISSAKNTVVNGNVLTNDTGSGKSVTIWNNPSHGTLSGKNNTTGAFTYTPANNYIGSDSFTYTIKDSSNNTSSATVYINVTEPYDETLSERDFTKRTQIVVAGDVTMIGNTVLCIHDVNGACEEPTSTSNSNASYDLKKAPESYSTLDLPAGVSGSNVKYARLYWQGRQDDTGTTSSTWSDTEKSSAKAIKLRHENVANSQGLTADFADFTETTSGDNYIKVYSAGVDVTGYVKANGLGKYYVDDLYTATGDSSDGLGNYGAWVLVVAYEIPGATQMRDITLFDGYKIVKSGNNVDFSVSGFLTPSGGDVKSEVYAFAGEGDKYLYTDGVLKTGDSVQLGGLTYNTSYTKLGTFDSRISTPGARSPSLSNNNGIDIHKYDVGETTGAFNKIINNETGAKFRFTSDQDTYFPSVLLFATDIFSPNISITKTPSSSPSGTLQPGDGVDYTATFTNVGQEAASEITVLDDFTANLQYNQSGGETDPKVYLSDLMDRNATKIKQSIRLSRVNSTTTWDCLPGAIGSPVCNGTATADCDVDYDPVLGPEKGATKVWCKLPTVAVNNTHTMKFSINISDNPDTKGQNVKVSNQMFASYKNALIGGSPITSGSNVADAGNYYGGIAPKIDAWETTIAGSPPVSANRKIYTKIANDGSATLRVGSFEATGSTYSDYTAGMIGWRIIPTTSCPTGDNNVTNWADLNLTNTSPNTNPQDISFVIPKAGRSYSVQFTNKSNGSYITANRHCSSDSFAVRPDRLDVSIASGSSKLLKAGEDYALLMTARDVLGATTTDYNQDTANLTYVSPPTKYNPDDTANPLLNGIVAQGATNYTFVNGITSQAQFSFSDVGKIKLDVNDTEWSSVDASDGTPIANRTIHGEGNFTFIPFRFVASNINIIDSQNGNYTYMSNDMNMSAKFGLQITAQNKQAVITQNFATGLYENPLSITPVVNDTVHGNGTVSGITNAMIGGFTAGVANITWNDTNTSRRIMFNFPRNASTPVDPFEIINSETDLTISSAYADGAFNATIENNSTNQDGATNGTGGNATFFYGRADAPDYRFSNNPGCGRVFYEFYDSGVNHTIAQGAVGLMTLSESSDANWYQNTQHISSTDGNVTATSGTATITINLPGLLTPATGCSALGSPGNDKLGFAYNGGKGYPFRGQIQLDASDWLDVSNNNFGVEFYKQGSWVGETTKSKTATDSQLENISNRRIMW